MTGAVALGLLAFGFPVAPAQAQWCETLVDSIPIAQTQDDGQLALDPATRLLFVARRDQDGIGTDYLTVIDIDAGAVVAEIPGGPDPIAIALDTQTHRVYVANTATFTPPFETSISVYDGDPASPTFLDELTRIPTLYKPAGLAVDEVGGIVFADTRDEYDFSSEILAIDTASLSVVATATSDARVYWRSLGFDPSTGLLFAARERGGVSDPGEYEVYDFLGTPIDVLALYDVMPYPNTLQRASGLGIDAAAHRLYHRGGSLNDGGRLEVWDTAARVHLDGFEMNVGGLGLGLDPSRDRLFTPTSTIGAFQLAVVDTAPLAVSHALVLGGAPRSVVVDPQTHRVYVYVGLVDPLGARIDVFAHDPTDSDGDGLAGGCDNCPGDANADQSDVDGDLIGDACDPDIDNDGCFNEVDQDPTSSIQLVGSWVSESCTPRSGSTYQTTLADSDFDGELDCSDLDDDDDGIPDENPDGTPLDLCPVVPGTVACLGFRSCGLRPWWDVCVFSSSCREYFVKIVSVINPDPTIVFRTVEILNTSIWLAPDVETSLADAAAALGGAGSGLAARGAGSDLVRIELWSKGGRGGAAAFEALIAEYDPADLRIGDVSRGRWLVVRPPEFGGEDPTVFVDASWIAGGAPVGNEPDADGDGIPNPFDACLTSADVGVDANADGVGNECDADYDDDGRVGASDETLLDAALGATCADRAYGYDLDRDSDCAIGAVERDLIAAQGGGPPGPSGRACPPGTGGECDHELPACANGLDDDGDGLADFPADPGCQTASSTKENPKCDDDLDNDGDGKIDWDGGRIEPRDPQCVGTPWKDKEAAPACGFGAELALLMPLLSALRRRGGSTSQRNLREISSLA